MRFCRLCSLNLYGFESDGLVSYVKTRFLTAVFGLFGLFVYLYLDFSFHFSDSLLQSVSVRCFCVADNKMVGSVDTLNEDLRINGAVEPLPEDFDATSLVTDPVPSAVVDNGGVNEDVQINKGKEKRLIVLGRNIHTMSLEVTEPDADDDVTGDREAYMASVLARYKRALTERTKHHLGLTIFALLMILLLY